MKKITQLDYACTQLVQKRVYTRCLNQSTRPTFSKSKAGKIKLLLSPEMFFLVSIVK